MGRMRAAPFLAWVSVVTGASACNGQNAPITAGTGGTAGTPTGGTAGLFDRSLPGQLEFEHLRASFGPLETLAGSGVAGPETNDWQGGFEGGPATRADLSTPHNALGDAHGSTFIADKDAHAIRKVARDGTLTTVAGMNEAGDDGDAPALGAKSHLNQPNGLWVKPDGTVYILDLGNRKVRRLDPGGTLSTLFEAATLRTGRGLWVADDESLAYVCSGNQVLRWKPETGVAVFSQPFAELGNLFVDSDGILFVTDRGANRVFRVDADGTAYAIAGSGATSGPIDHQLALEAPLNGVRGIWGSATSGLLLATHEGSQVLYLDSTGYFHVLVDGALGLHTGDGEPLTAPGQKLSEVRNVTINPQGALLITENDLGFIRIARPTQ